MKINHIIIHELDKEGGSVGAKLTAYSSVIDNEDIRVVKLVNEINKRYKNRNETYGVFDASKTTEFHTAFDNYFKSGLTEEEFVQFSILASKDLETRIDSNAPAKGGYLIYANYEASRNFVGVFLVRNTLGLSFNTNNKKKEFNKPYALSASYGFIICAPSDDTNLDTLIQKADAAMYKQKHTRVSSTFK